VKPTSSGVLVLLLFLLALAGSMVAHGTTCEGAKHRVMSGIVACDTANHRPLDAAFREGGRGRQQDKGQEKRSGELHDDHLEGLCARLTINAMTSFPFASPSGG
jgi:hypothetical protein